MKKVCAIALLVLLAGLFLTVLPETAEAWTSHAPISINTNAGFTALNGVTGGSGTPGDPYIIEGWEIDATGTVGIRVMNTDAPFVIRDVYIHSDGTNEDVNIFLGWIQDARVEDSILTDNSYAVNLLISNNVTFVNNTLTADDYGIYLDRADNTTLINNTISADWRSMRLTQSENLTMTGNTIASSGMWLQEYGDEPALYNSHTITTDNTVNGNPLYYHSNCNGVDVDGIPVGQLIVASCTDVHVANVEITDTSDSIQFFHVEDAVVSNATVSSLNYGVGVFFSTNVTFEDMDIHDSGWGAYTGTSDGLRFINNTFTSTSNGGLNFGGTGNGTIQGNVFVSSGVLLGLSLDDHDTLTIQDNTVNGEPLLYYNDCSGVELDGVPGGQVIMVNCTDVRVANLDTSDTTRGITMAHVSGADITDNVVDHGTYGGIVITDSDNLTLSGNTVSACGQNGIYASNVYDSVIAANDASGSQYDGLRAGTMLNVTIAGNDFSHNGWNGIYSNNPVDVTVTGNVLSYNDRSGADIYRTHWSTVAGNRASSNAEHGLYLWYSDNLTVVANNVSSNGLAGIRVENAADILLHHNYIDNAPSQAYDDGANAWDDGYPSGGNYWADYAGVDDCSGVDQDICTGGDGIGDTNYTIDGDSVDNYPLMAPYADTELPAIQILSPAHEESFTVPVINVTGTASDTGLSGLALVEVRVNYGNWVLASGTDHWTAHVTLTLGNNTIEARATDGHGNSELAMINVTLTSEPPTASFTVDPASGGTSTEFTVDASGSTDPEDATAALEVRWDWENDGTWDTAWSTTKTATHTYDSAGTYTIRLEVRDTTGNTHSTTIDVEVTEPAEIPPLYLILAAFGFLLVVIVLALYRLRGRPPEKLPEEELAEPEEVTAEE